jgi:lipopolysaccharide/colanic/teichoic acid biosynthesis glycosyltransferase
MIDVVVAAAALIVLSPVFALIAWFIARDSEGPIFFRQTRLGMDQRAFTTLKFRTMKVGTSDAAHREYVKQTMDCSALPNENGIFKLDRSDAVTRVGLWLRKTSLDELPQLINVLRGDMSLVGPRPCIPYETANFADYHFERFHVPAGVTGLWQVTARAHATFGEALDMDVAYARSWSLGLDLWLLFRTPFKLVTPKGTR